MALPDDVLNDILTTLGELKVEPIAVWSYDSEGGIVHIKVRDRADLDTVADSGQLDECDLTIMAER